MVLNYLNRPPEEVGVASIAATNAAKLPNEGAGEISRETLLKYAALNSVLFRWKGTAGTSMNKMSLVHFQTHFLFQKEVTPSSNSHKFKNNENLAKA